MKKQKIKDDLLNQISEKAGYNKFSLNKEKENDNARNMSDTLQIQSEEKTALLHREHQKNQMRRVLDLQKGDFIKTA